MTQTPGLPARTEWSPFGEGMDNFFEGFFRPLPKAADPDAIAAPAIDVVEKADCFEVKVNMPGVKKEDLDVSIHDGVLEVRAEAKMDTEEKDGERVLRRERRYGRYARAMRLGSDVDEENLAATYKDGVLVVTAPKMKQLSPKKIDIN